MKIMKILGSIPLIVIAFGLLSQVMDTSQSINSGMQNLDYVMIAAGILFVTISGYGVYVLYQKGDPVWPQRFAVVALAGIFLFGALTWVYGGRFVSDPAAQQAFVIIEGQDPRGLPGDPKYMGHQNNAGKWVRTTNPLTGELFHPSECRTKVQTLVKVVEDGVTRTETEMLPVPHKGFDYANDGLCVSPTDGKTKLVPWETKYSPILPDLNPLSSPAERAAEEAAEQEKIDEAHRRRVELQLQREKARLAALEPDVAPCNSHKLRSFKNCYRVTVKRNGPPFLMTKSNPANAIMRDDADGSRVEVSGLNFAYYHDSPSMSQVTFSVWEMTPGQTYRTANIDYTHE